MSQPQRPINLKLSRGEAEHLVLLTGEDAVRSGNIGDVRLREANRHLQRRIRHAIGVADREPPKVKPKPPPEESHFEPTPLPEGPIAERLQQTIERLKEEADDANNSKAE